jgi:hypothetical protein
MSSCFEKGGGGGGGGGAETEEKISTAYRERGILSPDLQSKGAVVSASATPLSGAPFVSAWLLPPRSPLILASRAATTSADVTPSEGGADAEGGPTLCDGAKVRPSSRRRAVVLVEEG